MKHAFLVAFLAVAACHKDKPPAPTEQQAAQLNEAEDMLNAAANEEGPEQSPSPSNNSN